MNAKDFTNSEVPHKGDQDSDNRMWGVHSTNAKS